MELALKNTVKKVACSDMEYFKITYMDANNNILLSSAYPYPIGLGIDYQNTTAHLMDILLKDLKNITSNDQNTLDSVIDAFGGLSVGGHCEVKNVMAYGKPVTLVLEHNTKLDSVVPLKNGYKLVDCIIVKKSNCEKDIAYIIEGPRGGMYSITESGFTKILNSKTLYIKGITNTPEPELLNLTVFKSHSGYSAIINNEHKIEVHFLHYMNVVLPKELKDAHKDLEKLAKYFGETEYNATFIPNDKIDELREKILK